MSQQGLNRSKIQILEALLRLRQAACHPGLIDPARRQDPSAKLDALLPQLEEVIEEGHKALVFSQFTSLLAIVRERLDSKGDRLRVPRRPDARPRSPRRAIPERPGLPAVPDQPQGRRARAEPHRRRVRLPARPVVEPGRRGPGHRPRPPHRPGTPGLRLRPDRQGHGRGKGPGAAAVPSATWPTPSSTPTTA